MKTPVVARAPPCRRALVCSDLHCSRGSPCAQLARACSLAESLEADCLAVAGDLFNDLHEPVSAEKLAEEVKRILGAAEPPRLIVYATSLSSHDPILPGVVEAPLGRARLVAVPGVAVLDVSGLEVCVLHGDILFGNGAAAYLFNRLASLLGRPLLVEEKLRERLRCQGLLVAGHTHIAGLDTVRGVANPGAWRREWIPGLPYWRRPSETCIVVDGGGARIVHVP